MKIINYLFLAFLPTACGSNSNSYDKIISDFLLKGKPNNIDLKILEATKQGEVTVADSIAYLTDEYHKDNELIIKRIELAKTMTKDLQVKTKLRSEYDKYQDDISVMDNRIDSIRNLNPTNLRGYDARKSDEVLATIVRCKYSLKVGDKLVNESFDFYLSPDGSKCLGKKGI